MASHVICKVFGCLATSVVKVQERDVGYDPFFLFKILDYFHYLLTDPRICSKLV